jgi:lipopolysaccharide export system permease protein
LTVPIAVLLACLFSVGFLSKRNELLAMRAAGVSLMRLAAPLLLMGLLVSFAVMAAGETIYPRAEAERSRMEDQLLKGTPPATGGVHRRLVALGLEGRVFSFRTFNVPQGLGTDATVQEFAGGRIAQSWEFQRLQHDSTGWIGVGVSRRVFSTVDSAAAYMTADTTFFPQWHETPEDFVRGQIDPQRTTRRELRHLIDRLHQTGNTTYKEETELALKTAFPFLSTLVILVGFPIAARTRQSGMALNFGIAMGITFVLRVLIEVFRALGHNGDIAPWLAAWAPNMACLAFGLIVLLRTRR